MLTLMLLLPVLLSLKLQPSTMTSLPLKWPSCWRTGPSAQGRRWPRRTRCWRWALQKEEQHFVRRKGDQVSGCSHGARLHCMLVDALNSQQMGRADAVLQQAKQAKRSMRAHVVAHSRIQ